ncbi:hypothetical protein Pcinc_010797 [Petrolisthes cinctipes]|uniref:Uncharacterized protein n=1 Tax=Petrolisthes cinctipes TaxID=88211 RepID=A0AAE1G265_PETCI|nr:hypothetical protein Pcinc_010797 [Petrolisthes cinctipes]
MSSDSRAGPCSYTAIEVLLQRRCVRRRHQEGRPRSGRSPVRDTFFSGPSGRSLENHVFASWSSKAIGTRMFIPSSALVPEGRRSAKAFRADALTEDLMDSLPIMIEGCLRAEEEEMPFCDTGADVVDEDMLERGVDLLISSIATATAASAPKRRRRTTIDFTPTTEIDKVLSNDPLQTEAVIDNLNRELSYWNTSILSNLGKTGRLDTFVKTFILRINRATLGVPFKTQMTQEEISYCKIDVARDKPPLPTVVETILNFSSLHLKLWNMYMKTSRHFSGGTGGKFATLLSLHSFWHKVANAWYKTHLNNNIRDSMLALICNGARSMFQHDRDVSSCPAAPLIQYPVAMVKDQRISDYAIKLYLELVLSHHIHMEWKLEMAKYLSNKGIGMVDQAFSEDAEGGSVEVYYAFEPCAARFWDFCKSEKPPSSIEYAIITPEPASHPCVSSGSGLFGHLTHRYHRGGGRCDEAPTAPEMVIAKSTRTSEPSTRR